MRRGFTVLELMISLAILPIVIMGVGAFYLEGRIATTRIESQVRLTRSLSLAHEIVGRDLRGAHGVQSGAALVIRRSDDEVRYVIGDHGLARQVGDRVRIVAPRITTIAVAESEEGYTIKMRATRKLVKKRRLTFERESFVARRR